MSVECPVGYTGDSSTLVVMVTVVVVIEVKTRLIDHCATLWL